ncbi:hypothetical protein JYU34_009952 [Plutella xylostella]|uniref:Uncharacterized protein n=1 Tax=Plutella xylostella TaxID=51655 RepID=A0ABQ7QKR2_PLUXY|nr:uncharacterized protein LOC105382746 [Plutella xylostella]KAG7305806.1 hypothetical protein JYU34_009952 [Plutella xylostella]
MRPHPEIRVHDCLNVRGQQNASRGGYVCVPGEPRPGDKGGGGGGGGGDPGARQGVFWVVTPDGRGRPGPGLWFLAGILAGFAFSTVMCKLNCDWARLGQNLRDSLGYLGRCVCPKKPEPS